jgi:hypothetical protein
MGPDLPDVPPEDTSWAQILSGLVGLQNRPVRAEIWDADDADNEGARLFSTVLGTFVGTAEAFERAMTEEAVILRLLTAQETLAGVVVIYRARVARADWSERDARLDIVQSGLTLAISAQ